MSNNKLVLYGLECGHAAPAPATLVSGLLTCAWCRTPKLISGVIEYEWAANCKDCTFKRWAGLSKHNAGIFANGHANRNSAHRVVVEYVKNPAAVTTSAKFNAWTGRKTG